MVLRNRYSKFQPTRTRGGQLPAAREATGERFPLPESSAVLIRECLSQNKCHNLGLLLQKYIGPWSKDWRWKEENKNEFLKKVVSAQNKFDQANSLLKDYLPRWKAMLASFQGLRYVDDKGQEGCWSLRDFTASPRWRLVVGLGSASILETSLTLHPIYGFPIIPGSSLKGLARAYAEEVDKAREPNPQDDPDIKEVFGFQKGDKAQAGKVLFFDAVPTSLPVLKQDIMNVHYKEYYDGKQPPADWLSPNSVYFLTVTDKTKFLFAVASPVKRLAGLAQEWLKGGLRELGAGAKTLVGYGHFNV